MGESFSWLEIVVIEQYRGFLLMALPPGGFLMLGFILAGKKILDRRLQARAKAEPLAMAQTSA
jgi:electron transport complex protein RnfE